MNGRIRILGTIVCAGAVLLGAAAPARAEIVEEIVAWVNGDIVTTSDLKEEEEAMISEAYRRYTGDDLDQRVETIRQDLLMRIIDRKILMQKAKTMFDVDRMGEAFYDSFKEQQGISDDDELKTALEREGMTVADLKDRLIEMFAPEEVLRYEVGNRVAVGDRELETYYAEHPEQFVVPAEVTVREIVLLAESDEEKTSRRAEAEAIRQRAETEDFAELAKEVSEAGTADEGGLLGPLKRGELSEALEQVAFNLPVGQVSDLLTLPHGYHILKIESRTETTKKPLDEIREDLRDWLENRKYAEQLKVYMDKARTEADWCVKAKFIERLPEEDRGQTCKSL